MATDFAFPNENDGIVAPCVVRDMFRGMLEEILRVRLDLNSLAARVDADGSPGWIADAASTLNNHCGRIAKLETSFDRLSGRFHHVNRVHGDALGLIAEILDIDFWPEPPAGSLPDVDFERVAVLTQMIADTRSYAKEHVLQFVQYSKVDMLEWNLRRHASDIDARLGQACRSLRHMVTAVPAAIRQ